MTTLASGAAGPFPAFTTPSLKLNPIIIASRSI